MRVRSHSRWLGWIGLGVIVIAADTFGDDTMSTFARNAARNPRTAPFVYAAWMALTIHLFGPPELDPFRACVRFVPRNGLTRGNP